MVLNFNTLLKSFWFWFLIIFISIQFIPMNVPEKLKDDPTKEIETPKEVKNILKHSCYVCHSNSLHFPWYDKIAPASWFAKEHVKNGRRAINFSNWKNYTKEKQLNILKKIPKSVIIRMPLPSYLWLHDEAKLSQDEKKLLKKWAKNLTEKIK